MKKLLPMLPAVLGLALFARVASQADAELLWRALASPTLLAALALPYALLLALDGWGLARLLRAAGVQPPAWPRLAGQRLACDAVAFSLPSGSLLGEGVALALLRRRGVGLRVAAAALLTRRLLFAWAHVLTVCAGIALGFRELARLSPPAWGAVGLPALAIGAAVAAVAACGAATLVLAQGRSSRGLARGLGRRLALRFRAGLASLRPIEDALARLLAQRRAVALALLAFVPSWFLESVESFLILTALDAPVTFVQVLAFDSLLALLRALFTVLPAGLGVQDAGWVWVIGGLVGPGGAALGAALAVLKRAREAAVIGLGYLALAQDAGVRPALSLAGGRA